MQNCSELMVFNLQLAFGIYKLTRTHGAFVWSAVFHWVSTPDRCRWTCCCEEMRDAKCLVERMATESLDAFNLAMKCWPKRIREAILEIGHTFPRGATKWTPQRRNAFSRNQFYWVCGAVFSENKRMLKIRKLAPGEIGMITGTTTFTKLPKCQWLPARWWFRCSPWYILKILLQEQWIADKIKCTNRTNGENKYGPHNAIKLTPSGEKKYFNCAVKCSKISKRCQSYSWHCISIESHAFLARPIHWCRNTH